MNRPTNPVPLNPVVETPIELGGECVAPHEIECEILHRLQSHPSLKFTRLSVHQCDKDSIFIEGTLESNDEDIDLCDVVRGVHGIKTVVNRVNNIHPIRKSK